MFQRWRFLNAQLWAYAKKKKKKRNRRVHSSLFKQIRISQIQPTNVHDSPFQLFQPDVLLSPLTRWRGPKRGPRRQTPWARPGKNLVRVGCCARRSRGHHRRAVSSASGNGHATVGPSLGCPARATDSRSVSRRRAGQRSTNSRRTSLPRQTRTCHHDYQRHLFSGCFLVFPRILPSFHSNVSNLIWIGFCKSFHHRLQIRMCVEEGSELGQRNISNE
jgi:hypothetical protein